MSSLTDIISYALFPFNYMMQPESQYYWLTYLAAGFTAVVLYMRTRRKSRISFRAIKEIILPSRLLAHESSKLDVKLFFVSLYYLVLQVLLVGGTTVLSLAGTTAALNKLLGAGPAPLGPSYVVTGVTIILVFLAVEFGYWFSHFLMHKVPVLWEFHKVHHSAEVLTPLTEWRQHPLELALFPVLMGAAACLVQAPMVWLFGATAQIIDPVKANLISMAFWYTILHLRHTELPIYATGWLGKIIQAPAHHQVHHSTNPAHFDLNMGYCLSIWDWAFGTLYVPRKGERFEFGLGHKDEALETAIGSVVAPIGRACVMLLKACGIEIKKAPDAKQV